MRSDFLVEWKNEGTRKPTFWPEFLHTNFAPTLSRSDDLRQVMRIDNVYSVLILIVTVLMHLTFLIRPSASIPTLVVFSVPTV